MSAPTHQLGPRQAPPVEMRIAFRAGRALPWFILPARTVSQVVIAPQLARVPNAKGWLKGVISLNGNMAPVFDYSDWFEQQAVATPDCVLVIQPGPDAVGLVCSDRPRLLEVREPGPLPADDPLVNDCRQRFSSELGPVYEFSSLQWISRVAPHLPGRSLGASTE